MNKFMMIGQKVRAFEAAGEGTPGGEGAGADAEKAAEDAVKKAQEDATKAADDAAKLGTADAAALAREKAALLSEVMDKKAKLAEATKKAADAAKALEAYGGVDPAKVKELLKKEEDAQKAELEAKGEFERLRNMMAEEHAKETKALKEALEAEKAERARDRELIDTLTVGNAFGNSVFIKEKLILSPAKTRALYGPHFEMKDGQLVGYDKPAGAANRTLLVNSAGDPLAFDEALTRIIDADPDKKSVMASTMKPGAGSAAQDTKKTEEKKGDNLFGASRIAAALANDKG